MRLELGTFPVTEVIFSDRTEWDDGTLEVDAKGLAKHILRDHRITGARLELVNPGESVRITSVRDVIEPRVKVSGPGICYPGLFGRPVVTVGQGRTHRLSGIAVIEVAEVEFYHGNDAWLDTAIDMSGPGAVAPYSNFPNICVVLEVDPSLTIEDQNVACNQAALLVSDTLAEAIRDLDPPDLEVFELAPTPPDMPKAVYIMCLRSPQHYANTPDAHWLSIYGLSRLTTPWLLHPNEIIDGAIAGLGSWEMVNNSLVLDMCGAHGKEFNFLGVLALRTRWSAQNEKDITSLQAAKMAKMMGADGAVITFDAGGNDFMETIRTVQACENLGVKTVFMTWEESPDAGGPPLLEPLPEASAIVSLGQRGGGQGGKSGTELPGVRKLIGQKLIVADGSQRQRLVPADGPVPGPRWSDQYGLLRTSAFDY
jgi:glycine reductase